MVVLFTHGTLSVKENRPILLYFFPCILVKKWYTSPQPMRTFIPLIFCLILSSCGFGHLTETVNQDRSAPTAKECGECHVDQYSEWQKSRHAKAFISPEFARQSDHYTDTDCLFCHAPGDVQDPQQQTRHYNRNEGVTCISCHLHNQTMHGPHDSDGLFSPHAVLQNDRVNSRLESSKLCGICHIETFEQWQAQQERSDSAFPTCHECHGAPVTRSHTKGTNLFSSILVSFEDEHDVRSHNLMLPGHVKKEVLPRLHLVSDEGNTVTYTITNTLPHDLPTGSFGDKEIVVRLRRLRADTILATAEILLPTVLSPTQKITLTSSLPHGNQSKHVQFTLLRRHGSVSGATLLQTYEFNEDDDAKEQD